MKLCSSSSSRPSSGGGGGGGGDSMGVDHRETREGGGISPGPKIWSRKDANAKCPPPQILSCFKISNTRLFKASAYRYK